MPVEYQNFYSNAPDSSAESLGDRLCGRPLNPQMNNPQTRGYLSPGSVDDLDRWVFAARFVDPIRQNELSKCRTDWGLFWTLQRVLTVQRHYLGGIALLIEASDVHQQTDDGRVHLLIFSLLPSWRACGGSESFRYPAHGEADLRPYDQSML